MPVILLRNLDFTQGLANGTRLIIVQLGRRVIKARIMTGADEFRDKEVLIPRIPLAPSETAQLPITFTRLQFPIRPAFAMTINKAQGQTFDKVGIFLPRPVFSHGQLYVAMSRVGERVGVRVMVVNGARQGEAEGAVYTDNVVYGEVFDGGAANVMTADERALAAATAARIRRTLTAADRARQQPRVPTVTVAQFYGGGRAAGGRGRGRGRGTQLPVTAQPAAAGAPTPQQQPPHPDPPPHPPPRGRGGRPPLGRAAGGRGRGRGRQQQLHAVAQPAAAGVPVPQQQPPYPQPPHPGRGGRPPRGGRSAGNRGRGRGRQQQPQELPAAAPPTTATVLVQQQAPMPRPGPQPPPRGLPVVQQQPQQRWPPSALQMGARRDAAGRLGVHVGGGELEMTFTWFYGPLIGHAMGQGHLFPDFPAQEPQYVAWVADVHQVILGMPGGQPLWEAIIDRGHHVSAAFQNQVQHAMEWQLMEELNAYASGVAHHACQVYNQQRGLLPQPQPRRPLAPQPQQLRPGLQLPQPPQPPRSSRPPQSPQLPQPPGSSQPPRPSHPQPSPSQPPPRGASPIPQVDLPQWLSLFANTAFGNMSAEQLYRDLREAEYDEQEARDAIEATAAANAAEAAAAAAANAPLYGGMPQEDVVYYDDDDDDRHDHTWDDDRDRPEDLVDLLDL